jgi:Glycosyltransferase family 28 C-terminal domain
VLVTLPPGHAREELGQVPANARLAGFVPHGPVLGRACLAVSHAGHGIVMRALRHGVPMVLVPWGRDQPGVAARAEALGVAALVPRAACTEERVAEAVGRVLAGPRTATRRGGRPSGCEPTTRSGAPAAGSRTSWKGNRAANRRQHGSRRAPAAWCAGTGPAMMSFPTSPAQR